MDSAQQSDGDSHSMLAYISAHPKSCSNDGRPESYLMSLLVVRAYENTHSQDARRSGSFFHREKLVNTESQQLYIKALVKNENKE